MSEFDFLSNAKIKIFGIGGGGSNAVNRMADSDMKGIEFYVVNADIQSLDSSPVPNKIQIGADGLGAGGKPEVARKAAEDSSELIRESVGNADMVFITAGMGGGTGTGASPIVAKIAKELGCLVVGVVTKPFSFEGPKRMKQADNGIEELKKYVDSLIVIANNRVLEVMGGIPFSDAFKEADGILRQAVQTITDLIAVPATINLDYSDIEFVMKNAGTAVFGIGLGKGDNKAVDAAKQAVLSPLLDFDIRGAKNAIVNVAGGNDMTVYDASEAIRCIQEATGDQLDIIFGVSINENLGDQCIVSLIATGFPEK